MRNVIASEAKQSRWCKAKHWIASLLTLLAMTVISPAFAAEELPRYSVAPEGSKLKFVAIQNDAPVEGAFSRYTADIRFDPKRLDESSITVEVDMSSVFTAYPEVGTTLATADWFDVASFPKAHFRTITIKEIPPAVVSDDRKYYYADSELSLRGVKMPLALNFVLESLDASGAIATGHLTLQRTDFGVGQGEWKNTEVVQNPVTVSFRIAAKREK